MTDELTAILHQLYDHLIKGGASRHSAMHTPVVGTSDGDLRVMVLREFDPATNTLRFHTDARSPKVAAIGAAPAMSVLAYSPEAKVQIRMRGVGRVEHDGPVANAAWSDATTFARRCYLAEAPPSSAVPEPTSGLPEWAEGLTPSEEQVAPARANFAVLLMEVREFDWLYLANSGHRRARFTVSGDQGAPSGEWLVP